MPSNGMMSDYLAHELLDDQFGKGAWTPPANRYLALLKSPAAPGDGADELDEPTDWTNYARKILDPSTFNVASARKIVTNAEHTFGTATASADEDLTSWAIVDSASGAGNILWLGALQGTIRVQNGQPVTVPAASLVCQYPATAGTAS